MAQHELENMFSASLEGLKGMIDTETVIGKPIETLDGTTIIPITKLSFGYGMGGWNYDSSKGESKDNNNSMTAGAGGGVTVEPVGFLVVSDGNVRILNVDAVSPFEKICEMLPTALDSIGNMFNKGD